MTNLEKWCYYLRDLESPDIFIKWTFYWTIGSALQRRVFLGEPKFEVFPNQFIIFVAEPGIGKSLAARLSGSLVLKTYTYINDKIKDNSGNPIIIPEINFSADATTPESLIQQLAQSSKTYMRSAKTLQGEWVKIPGNHTSLCVLLSEEMTSLFRKNMDDMAGFLNQWWDAQDFYYKTKHGVNEDRIKNICVNLLGCTTPSNIKKLVMSGVLDQGFTARAIFLYADKHRHRKLEFGFDEGQMKAFDEVKTHIKKLLSLEGPLTLSPEAKEWFREYYESGKLSGEVANKDPRLNHYLGRIKVHTMKLAIVHHFADNAESMTIELNSVKNAVSDLREAEVNMHRALCSSATNPMFNTAQGIQDLLAKVGTRTRLELKMAFLADVDEMCIEAALKFLLEANKIKAEVIGTKTVFKLI